MHDEVSLTGQSATSKPPRWSILRLALVFVLGALGAFAVLANVALLMEGIFLEGGSYWREMPWRFKFWEIEIRLVAIWAGCTLIIAGRLFWRRRTQRGLVVTGIAALMFVINQPLNTTLRRHFAGEGYLLDANGEELVVEVDGESVDLASLGDGLSLEAPFDATTASEVQATWARRLHRMRIEPNSIGMNLVLIPPGSFVMGSTDTADELGQMYPIIVESAKDPAFRRLIESERPQHLVLISRPFYLGQQNVSIGQFRQFVDASDYKTEAESDGQGGGGFVSGHPGKFGQQLEFNWQNTGFEQTESSPVVDVSWNDAVAFCEWLSRKEGKTYRLPTEAEWEYSCRAGSALRFYGSDDAYDLRYSANVADERYYEAVLGEKLELDAIRRGTTMGMMVLGQDGHAFTSPVGVLIANAFGLHDMHGNASTWCADWYDSSYYQHSPLENPLGPASGKTRVVRGGNWQFYPAFCRSAARFQYAPSRREPFIGLRVVCEIGTKQVVP